MGVGRGRGNATNVPERHLIQQVKIRPLLYDKTVKDYRKVSVIIPNNCDVSLKSYLRREYLIQHGMKSQQLSTQRVSVVALNFKALTIITDSL